MDGIKLYIEIWGWREREEMEKIEERYIRWVFGLNRTPGYLSKGRNTKRKIKGKGGKEGMRI